MPGNLTKTQHNTLQAIATFMEENDMSPTLRELQTLLNVSSNQAVINHLDILEEKGYIRREEKKARGIKLLSDTSKGRGEKTSLLSVLARVEKGRKKQKRATAISVDDFDQLDESPRPKIISWNVSI
jgi:repressor LexA